MQYRRKKSQLWILELAEVIYARYGTNTASRAPLPDALRYSGQRRISIDHKYSRMDLAFFLFLSTISGIQIHAPAIRSTMQMFLMLQTLGCTEFRPSKKVWENSISDPVKKTNYKLGVALLTIPSGISFCSFWCCNKCRQKKKCRLNIMGTCRLSLRTILNCHF